MLRCDTVEDSCYYNSPTLVRTIAKQLERQLDMDERVAILERRMDAVEKRLDEASI